MPRKRDEHGYWFDEDAAERVVEFFPRYLPHVKGPMMGRPLKLGRWMQDEIVRPLFGWKRPHTHAPNVRCDPNVCEYGRRRYTEVNLFVPRKQVKTTLIAGLGIYCTVADGELGAENYFAAFDLEQAGIDWEIAAAMIEQSPDDELRERLLIMRSTYRIVDPETNSFLAAVPAVAAGAQGYNVHYAGFDEHHTQVTMDLDRALTTGTGARRQPIIIRGSTAGRNLASPTGRIWTRIRDIKSGVRRAPEHELNVLYEAPPGADWRLLETWKRANPGYGTSLQPMYVRKEIQKAIDDPVERPDTLRYGLNIWPEAVEVWMPLEAWDACGGTVELDDLEGRSCVVAMSMPSTEQLAAVAILFPPESEDEPYRLRTEFYLPAELVTSRARDENAPPYHEWIDAGILHLTEGDVLDYETLEAMIQGDLARRFAVELVYNPRHQTAQLAQRLMAGDQSVVELVPSYKTSSPALNELKRLVRLGKKSFVHDGSLALRWMWTKCKVHTGPNEEIRIDRERSMGNVEGCVALVMAISRPIAGGEEEGEWLTSAS